MSDDIKLFEKLVAEAKSEINGFIDFNGQNCQDLGDNDCAGWDGESRRCECGNRRVSWELSDDKTYAYAEAW